MVWLGGHPNPQSVHINCLVTIVSWRMSIGLVHSWEHGWGVVVGKSRYRKVAKCEKMWASEPEGGAKIFFAPPTRYKINIEPNGY